MALEVAVWVGVDVMTGVMVPVGVKVIVEGQGVPLGFKQGVSVGAGAWDKAAVGEVGLLLPQLHPNGIETSASKNKITIERLM